MSKAGNVKASAITAGYIVLGVFCGILIDSRRAAANDFTAEKVMKEMKPEQRQGFVFGIVEGLAVARYMKDGKNKTGMECIYDWYFQGSSGQTLQTIYAAFERYPIYPPGSIVYTLVKQKCGE